MRSPVYRNLDTPFQIYGFSPLALAVLSLVFVCGGEIAQILSVHRIWVFLLTFILAFGIYSFRQSLGDLFLRRLLRFLNLPNQIPAKLFVTRRTS